MQEAIKSTVALSFAFAILFAAITVFIVLPLPRFDYEIETRGIVAAIALALVGRALLSGIEKTFGILGDIIAHYLLALSVALATIALILTFEIVPDGYPEELRILGAVGCAVAAAALPFVAWAGWRFLAWAHRRSAPAMDRFHAHAQRLPHGVRLVPHALVVRASVIPPMIGGLAATVAIVGGLVVAMLAFAPQDTSAITQARQRAKEALRSEEPVVALGQAVAMPPRPIITASAYRPHYLRFFSSLHPRQRVRNHRR